MHFLIRTDYRNIWFSLLAKDSNQLKQVQTDFHALKHSNENSVILMKFPLLAAMEVVILTMSLESVKKISLKWWVFPFRCMQFNCNDEAPSTNPAVSKTVYKCTCLVLIRRGLILGLRPANERRRYSLTASLIDWAQAWNQLGRMSSKGIGKGDHLTPVFALSWAPCAPCAINACHTLLIHVDMYVVFVRHMQIASGIILHCANCSWQYRPFDRGDVERLALHACWV